MRKILRIIIIIQIVILFIVGCNIINSSENNGYIVISVKFPSKKFNVKKIPLTAIKIDVEISGEGIINTMKYTLTPQNPKLNIITPIGNKTVKANAFDNNNILLAFGSSSVNVKNYIHNMVEIDLIDVSSSDSSNGKVTIPFPNPLNENANNPTPTPSNEGVSNSVPNQNIPDSNTSALPSPATSPSGNDSNVVNPSPTPQTASINAGISIINGGDRQGIIDVY